MRICTTSLEVRAQESVEQERYVRVSVCGVFLFFADTRRSIAMENKEDPQNEPSYLVGLSPSFWAHIPMEIASLRREVKSTNVGILLFRGQHAVSKCKLVGWIVSADHKSESHFYVVDDGTGLMDVLHWTEDEELVPPLLLLSDSSSRSNTMLTVKPNHYYPGDIVAIYGKIQFNEGNIEVHATTITNANGGDEYRHWNDCKSPQMTTPQHVLAKLGTAITDQINDLSNLPSADDSVGLWRLFGVHCPCESGNVKEDLLYCRCIATPEPLDPDLSFRWAMLELLLKMQQASQEPLLFPYNTVVNHSNLMNDDTSPNSTATLTRATFRALRRDGILHLCDRDADLYVLISRSRVLEPFVVQTMNKFANERPEALERVPKTRLQIVRRSVLQRNETTRNESVLPL